MYREHICVIIATIKIRSYGTSHKENFTDGQPKNDSCERSSRRRSKRRRLGINPVMKRHIELDIKRLFKMLQEIQTSWSGF